jgi:hypothetical protein
VPVWVLGFVNFVNGFVEVRNDLVSTKVNCIRQQTANSKLAEAKFL